MFSFFQDRSGQAGSVFKLLVGAVIGVAIVAIIVVTINILSDQKEYLTEEVFANKVAMAMKNPTGSEYVIPDLTFAENKVINKKSLSEKTGLNTSCIDLEVSENANNVAELGLNGEFIKFKKKTTVSVGVTCALEDYTECNMLCTLKVLGKGYSGGQ